MISVVIPLLKRATAFASLGGIELRVLVEDTTKGASEAEAEAVCAVISSLVVFSLPDFALAPALVLVLAFFGDVGTNVPTSEQ